MDSDADAGIEYVEVSVVILQSKGTMKYLFFATSQVFHSEISEKTFGTYSECRKKEL